MPLWWIKHYKVLSRVPFQWTKRGEVPCSDDFLRASIPTPYSWCIQGLIFIYKFLYLIYSFNNDNILYFAAQFIIHHQILNRRSTQHKEEVWPRAGNYFILACTKCCLHLHVPRPKFFFLSNNITAQPRLTFKTIKGILTSTSFEEKETWLVSKGIY